MVWLCFDLKQRLIFSMNVLRNSSMFNYDQRYTYIKIKFDYNQNRNTSPSLDRNPC